MAVLFQLFIFPSIYLLDSFIYSSQTVLGCESSEVLHEEERKGGVSRNLLELGADEMLPSCLVV